MQTQSEANFHEVIANGDLETLREALSAYDGPTAERPVDRSYVNEATELIPNVNPAFNRNLSADFQHIIANPESERMPVNINSPVGAGVPSTIAAAAGANNIPLIRIQGEHPLMDADIIGSTIMKGESFEWHDGPLLRAAAIAQHHPVVLHIDSADFIENDLFFNALARLLINPNETNGTFDTSDDATTNPLDDLERADSTNIITIFTAHGDYADSKLATLPLRTIEADFLDKDRETLLVKDATNIEHEIAGLFVRAAKDIRTVKEEEALDGIQAGTHRLVKWAQLAEQLAKHDATSPAQTAAIQTLQKPDASEDAATYIEQIAATHLAGVFD